MLWKRPELEAIRFLLLTEGLVCVCVPPTQSQLPASASHLWLLEESQTYMFKLLLPV